MLFWLLLFACRTEEPPADPPTDHVQIDAPADAPSAEGPAPVDPAHQSLFAPLPEVMESPDHPITEERITLGRILYYDPRLSLAGDISCNSCHLLDQFGVDGEATSPGHEGQRGARNSPTVYNAALHLAQFWDGRSPDVEDQAKGPILDPAEMAMPDEETVVARLKEIEGYAPLFAAAFPEADDPITYDNLASAIGAFERKLVTPDAFDAYLRGDPAALTPAQRAGLDTFVEVGCITCHSGVGLGGHMYQKMGLVEPWETEDPGRYDATGNEADRGVFKVPSLRNITETAPYLHDGSVADLGEVVRIMGTHQLGRELTDEQVASILEFFTALKGEIPMDYIAEPELPQ